MISDALRDAIEHTIRSWLTGGKIISVHSRRGRDHDGDDVIRVTVVVDAKAGDFPADRLASITTRLRQVLEANDEPAFPLTSFMSRQEWERERAA